MQHASDTVDEIKGNKFETQLQLTDLSMNLFHTSQCL